MQKPSEALLATVRELSIAERTYLAAYLDALAALGAPEERPWRGRPRKPVIVDQPAEEAQNA